MYLLKLLILYLFYNKCVAREEDILEFSDSDFDSRITRYETALVMFYAPWCAHCRKLKPEFAKAAEDLVRNVPPIAVAKIDCTEGGKETCNKLSISGYPTLKIYRNGQFSKNYNGPRQAASIVNYMMAQVSPSSTELNSVESLDIFLVAGKETTVVGLFEAESDLKTAFLETANGLKEKIRFAHTMSKQLLNKHNITDGIVLFRPIHLQNKFEDRSVKYEGKADVKDIAKFITKNLHGLVDHRTIANKKEFKNPLVVAFYNVDYVLNAKTTNYWRNRILRVAKEFEGRIRFAISDKDEFVDELIEYGLESLNGDKPVVVARDERNQKFVMNEEFSVETLKLFVNNVLESNLEPVLKSEPVPKSQDEPVKVAVANNFNELVVNSGRDALIEFYAPWCAHCIKLASVYYDLGDKLKNEDVDIIKMDATANDMPASYELDGFPTLYWSPRDAKSTPQQYQGGRELNDFIKYIAKHATVELKGYDRKGNPKLQKTEL